jgi:hypothetical protein
MTSSAATLPTAAHHAPRRAFTAVRGALEGVDERAHVDALRAWVRHAFREHLERRPSKHAYVSSLPPEIVARVHALRSAPAIRDAILRQASASASLTPMDTTDELYISHYNRDMGGDEGLFAKHYDGNLRFIPFGTVVRALIYVHSVGNYKVVFADSGVAHAFQSYEFGLLDFHRELHWVEGEYEEGAPDRILLKCNFLVLEPSLRWLAPALLGVNLGQFYVVKAAMEYSKSPKTPPQRVVGWVCNVVRVLNNVHPVLPLAWLTGMAAGAVTAAWWAWRALT